MRVTVRVNVDVTVSVRFLIRDEVIPRWVRIKLRMD